MLKQINSFHIHPKNKLLLYNRYVLSKLSWHLTVAVLSKTWICQHLDNLVSKYVRQWLELPFSATLSTIVLSTTNFGPPSVKFQQCQTILRSSLRSSKDDAIKNFWKVTNSGNNIQYDTYQNTIQVLKSTRGDHTKRLKSKLPTQSFIITFLLDRLLKNLNSLWSKAQSKLPTNIFNFTVKYLNNTLATRKNLCLWKLAAPLTAPSFFSLSHSCILLLVANRT